MNIKTLDNFLYQFFSLLIKKKTNFLIFFFLQQFYVCIDSLNIVGQFDLKAIEQASLMNVSFNLAVFNFGILLLL